MSPPPPHALDLAALMALQHLPPTVPAPEQILARRPGPTATRARGQGHLIRDIRPFQNGDDPRHLDPNASARTGRPQIRSFHDDREAGLMLLIDLRGPMFWGTGAALRSVVAATELMRQGWQASALGGAVGLITFGDAGLDVTPPRPREAAMARIAGHLVRAHAAGLARLISGASPPPPLDHLLIEAAASCPRGGEIHLASSFDHPGPNVDASLDALAARGPLTITLFEDPLETSPPAQPLPCHLGFAPDNTPKSLLCDLRALAQARANLRARLENHRLTLRHHLIAEGAAHGP